MDRTLKAKITLCVAIAASMFSAFGWLLAIGYQNESDRYRRQVTNAHISYLQICLLGTVEDTEAECDARWERAIGK